MTVAALEPLENRGMFDGAQRSEQRRLKTPGSVVTSSKSYSTARQRPAGPDDCCLSALTFTGHILHAALLRTRLPPSARLHLSFHCIHPHKINKNTRMPFLRSERLWHASRVMVHCSVSTAVPQRGRAKFGGGGERRRGGIKADFTPP